MKIQTDLQKLSLQYSKIKEDAKRLMLRGDLKNYVKKLVLITAIEDEYRNLSQQMKTAA